MADGNRGAPAGPAVRLADALAGSLGDSLGAAAGFARADPRVRPVSVPRAVVAEWCRLPAVVLDVLRLVAVRFFRLQVVALAEPRRAAMGEPAALPV